MNSSLERTNFLSLRLFLAVVERGSIADAARHSFIAPTAVTKRIQELEDSLGVQLLVRTSKGVLPTDAGRALAQHVRAMVDLSDRMHSEMKDYAKGVRGHVRLIANASALVEYLAGDVAGYMQSNPGIRIDIKEALSDEVVRAVRDGTADLGVFALPAAVGAGMEVYAYREDRLAVAVPCGHPLAQRDSVTFDELRGFPFIGVRGASSLSSLIAQASAGAAPSFRGTSNDVARLMVGKGLGITILPEGMIVPFAAALGLRSVAISEPWARRSLQLCVREAAALSTAARAFFDSLTPGPKTP